MANPPFPRILIPALLGLFCLSASLPAQAPAGTQSLIDLPSSRAAGNRVSAFYFDGAYYIAFSESDSDDEFDIKYGPAVFYGKTTLTDDPTTLTFDSAGKVSLSGFPTSSHNNIWHMAAGLLTEAPLIFYTNCEGTGSTGDSGSGTINSISLVEMVAPTTVGDAPTFLEAIDVPASIVSSIDNATDVAIAPYQDTLVLVYARAADYKDIAALQVSVVNAQVSSTDNSTIDGNNLQYDFTAMTDLPFEGLSEQAQSIDVTNVTLGDGSEALLVTALVNNMGNVSIMAWLWQPDVDSDSIPALTLSMPPPMTMSGGVELSPTYVQPGVRVAYGPLSGMTAANTASLFVSSSQFAQGTASIQVRWVNALSLTLPDSISDGLAAGPDGWQEANAWLCPYDPFWQSAFSAQLPVDPGSDYGDVYQYTAFVGIGENKTAEPDNNAITSSLSLQLVADSASPTSIDTSQILNLSEADLEAVVQSWTLLAVVTGIPPVEAELPAGQVSYILQLSFSSSSTTTIDISTQATIGVTAKDALGPINASAGFSTAAKSGVKTTGTQQQTITFGIEPAAQGPFTGTFGDSAEYGYLIVSQPSYNQGTYTVNAYDGTSLGFSVVATWLESESINSFTFLLSDPNFPLAQTPSPLLSFPTDDPIHWPAVPEILAWVNPPTLTGLSATALYNGSEYIRAELNSVVSGVALNQKSSVENSMSLTNTLSGSAEAPFFNINGSLTQSSIQAINFSDETGIVITYPSLTSHSSYSAIDIQPSVYLKDSTATSANWVPAVFAGSVPWVLTWTVTGYQTQGSSQGESLFLGTFAVSDEPADEDWRYYYGFQQWMYQVPGVAQWLYWTDLQTWAWVAFDSRPYAVYLYLDGWDTWTYTAESLYPWLYNFSTETWEYIQVAE